MKSSLAVRFICWRVICDNTLQRADNSKTYLATADQDDTTAHIIAIFWTCRNEWWSWLL